MKQIGINEIESLEQDGEEVYTISVTAKGLSEKQLYNLYGAINTAAMEEAYANKIDYTS